MTSHLALMILFSVCVSTVFAALLRDDPVEQVKFGGRALLGFLAAGIVLAWLLYPLPL